MLLPDQTVGHLIEAVYPGIADGQGGSEYFKSRAILAARNDDVAMINASVIDTVPGELFHLLSADSIDGEHGVDAIPMEYLNSLEVSGWPSHRLSVKVGTPVMLLRNLDPENGLCNGKRLTIRRCTHRVIEAEVITGEHAGCLALIPRIPLISENAGLPFAIRRRQFPLRVAYAMTINKAQGQTLSNVGICLTRDVFSHGQLYVAFTRATAPSNVKVLLAEGPHREAGAMRNVVYDEALR